MRALFIVGVKLLGLVVLYWGISAIGQLGLQRTALMGPGGENTWFSVWLVSAVLYGSVVGAFACFLLFRAERIADAVRLRDTSVPPSWPSQADLLRTGLLLLGVYFLLLSVPPLVWDLGVRLTARALGSHNARFVSLAAHAVQAVLALWLVLKPDSIADRLTKRRAAPTERA